MSPYPQDTLQSADVYKFTLNTLDTLPLKRPGAIQSRDLLRVLVFAAASRLSVHQAWDQLEGAPAGPTVLGNLASQCSALDALDGQVNDRLARLIPKGLGTRGRWVAVALVTLPYHGTVDEAQQDEVCRSKAKGGTTHFFPYATAYAAVRGHRDTLAMCRVRAKQRMADVLRTLRARLLTLGMRLTLLLLDRGFYSVRVLQDLITCKLPCIRPAVQRGKTPTPPAGPTGPYALAAEQHSRWPPSTLQSANEGRVDCALAVVWHHPRGQRGRHQREALLSATWGLQHRPLPWRRATYRRRFGIESFSRQSHQARLRTSSRKPALRLWFMGVALVLRNVWVWWPAAVMAQPQRGARQLRPQSLRFARWLLWLLMEAARHARLLRKIPVYHDLYEKAQAFGIVFKY